MKTLVVFYSRTGCTRTVAQALAARLDAVIEELRETTDRSGVAGYLRAGRDAGMRRPADLLPVACQPAAFDLTIVATPVWAFTMCPAVRTWLKREAVNIRRVAFVATQGGSGAERTFRHMEEIMGRPPVARLALIDKNVRAQSCEGQFTAFADTCCGAAERVEGGR